MLSSPKPAMSANASSTLRNAIPNIYTFISTLLQQPVTRHAPCPPRLRARIVPRAFSLRAFSTTLPRLQIPLTPACPSPTCACATTPPDLDIDRTSPLLHTVAAYSSQVLLCTGTAAWPSNIEQTPGSTGEIVAGLKSVIGKGAPGFDVCPFPL
jgi:hypothetical protein